jgi:uncharacterized protein (DUF2336 family)
MQLVEIVGTYFTTPLRPENAREHRIATEILRKLLRDASLEVRRRVAERLAWQPAAPLELVIELSHDDAAVARPLLIESAALSDAELIEVVHQRSIRHRLAISMRREVSGEVCRTLLAIGENEVACALLENPGARIPRECLEDLVERSRTTEQFHEPLVQRRDLPPDLAARLLGWVSDALRQEIIRNFAIDPAVLDPALRAAVNALKEEPSAQDAPGSHNRIAAGLHSRRIGDPGNLLVLLRSGDIGLFEAMFAQMTMLPTTVARRVIYEAGGRPLAVACRALGAQKSQFAGIFLLVRQARDDGRPVEPTELQAALTFFDGLDTASAARVLEELRNPPARPSAATARATRG